MGVVSSKELVSYIFVWIEKRYHMKKLRFLTAILLTMLTIPMPVSANMAAPTEPDVGTAVTFEKNDQIAVVSEVLDIVVQGTTADITATYRMQNTTDTAVSTDSMFVSPNMEEAGITVTANGTAVEFTTETWHLEYDSKLEPADWRYAVLRPSDRTESADWQLSCDTVTFTLDFAPGEAYDVVVSYTYGLGGYPHLDFNAKNGLLEYYLAPAAMWKDFQNLTINLTLAEDMPKLVDSSVDFEKVGPRQYRFVSDTLPEENLVIRIDENWVQNIASTLRSPYLMMNIFMLAPLWLPVLLVAIVVIVVVVRKSKHKKERSSPTEE